MLEIAAYFDTSLATSSALTFEKKSSSLVAIQYLSVSSSHLGVSFKPCLFALLKCNFFWKVVYTSSEFLESELFLMFGSIMKNKLKKTF